MSDGSAGDLITVLLNPSTLLAFVATLLVVLACVITRRVWPDRIGGHQIATIATLLAIVSLTQMPTRSLGQLRQIAVTSSLRNAVSWPLSGIDLASTLDSSGWWLNIALFVPLGFAVAGLLGGRLGRSALLLAAVAVATESAQAFTGFRSPDLADLVTNLAGGILGAAGWVVSRPLAERIRAKSWRLSPGRAAAIVIPTVVFACALVAGILLRSADNAQTALVNELEDAYESTSLDSMKPVFFGDSEQDQAFDAFLVATSVRPDSVVRRDAPLAVQVRYSDQYFGLHRCVFVTWEQNGVVFRRDSGEHCTEFLGS